MHVCEKRARFDQNTSNQKQKSYSCALHKNTTLPLHSLTLSYFVPLAKILYLFSIVSCLFIAVDVGTYSHFNELLFLSLAFTGYSQRNNIHLEDYLLYYIKGMMFCDCVPIFCNADHSSYIYLDY